ncbi:facilitated trehalose transporter Tret1-like [Bacillus rossius redtenbacheri]|uniref:facilitated trehalose transporter Tret1-like n=1 Tax=Bacillus rossius redtenbacheri TaxID=93214 RepID=UPI002FDDC1E4
MNHGVPSLYLRPPGITLQQMSGVNTATFYTTIIFKEAGSSMSPSHATIIVGASQVVFTLVSGLVVDRLGRKVLLMASDAIMSLCMFALGTFFYLQYMEQDVSALGWLPIASISVFFMAYALGYGPLPWVVMAEVFLPSVKGLAGAASCVVNWLLAFVVTKFFADMVGAFGTHTTFWIFAVLSLFGVVFVWLVVPETKGKTSDEIFKELNGDLERPRDLVDVGHCNEALDYELRSRMGLHI